MDDTRENASMTLETFWRLANKCISIDPGRPALASAFRFGSYGVATDGRIALIKEMTADEMCAGLLPRADGTQAKVGEVLIDRTIPQLAVEIARDIYAKYEIKACKMQAVAAAIMADMEPHIARSENPRDWYGNGTRVIMPNPARTYISGYYGMILADLLSASGPFEAFAHIHDSDMPLLFKGERWRCILMPLRSHSIFMTAEPSEYCKTSIADAASGALVARFMEDRPALQALRFPKKEGVEA